MLGEECSGATLPVMPPMEQANVRLLNAGSSSIKVTDPGSPWMLRVMPNEVMQGGDIATNAYKRLNARSAVLLYENKMRESATRKPRRYFQVSLSGQVLCASRKRSRHRGSGRQLIQLGDLVALRLRAEGRQGGGWLFPLAR